MTDETIKAAATDESAEVSETDADDVQGDSLEVTTADIEDSPQGDEGELPGESSGDLPGETEAEDEDTVTVSFDKVLGLEDEEAQEQFEQKIKTLPGFGEWLGREQRKWANDHGNLLQRMADVPKAAYTALQQMYEAASKEDEAAIKVTEQVLNPVRDAFSYALLTELANDPSVTGGKDTDFYRDLAPYFEEGRGDFLSAVKAWGKYREELGEAKGRKVGATDKERHLARKAELAKKAEKLQGVVRKTPTAPSRNSRPTVKQPDLTTAKGILASDLNDIEKMKLLEKFKGPAV